MTRNAPPGITGGSQQDHQIDSRLSQRNTKLLYSPRDIAHPNTPFPYESVLDMCISGRIAATKVGKRWVITPAAVQAFVDSVTVPDQREAPG